MNMNKEQLQKIVFEALGEVSMCWSETPQGVFESTRANEIGNRIMKAFDEYSIPSPSLPSDEEMKAKAIEKDFITGSAEYGYIKGATDMRSICSTRIEEMEAKSKRMMQLENALKDSQILLKNFKSYATDSSAPVYFGGVSLDDALNTNWNLIKSITTTP